MNQSSQVKENQWLILPEFDVASGKNLDNHTQFVDFLVITDNCIFVLEAKDYTGKIKPEGTDASNNPWMRYKSSTNTGIRINSCWGNNPYLQVRTYRNTLKSRLQAQLAKCRSVWDRIPVYGVVVFPQTSDVSSLGPRMNNSESVKIARSHYVTTLNHVMKVLESREEQVRRDNLANVPKHLRQLAAKQIEDVLRGTLP